MTNIRSYINTISVEVTTRGMDNNDEYYGTGEYEKKYELYAEFTTEFGKFKRYMTSSRLENIVKCDKEFLDIAIENKDHDYTDRMTKYESTKKRLELELAEVNAQMQSLQRIQYFQKKLTDKE
jgi:flagellar capping protein FliD